MNEVDRLGALYEFGSGEKKLEPFKGSVHEPRNCLESIGTISFFT